MHSPRKALFTFLWIAIGGLLLSYAAVFVISPDVDPNLLIDSKANMLWATVHQQVITLIAACIAIYIWTKPLPSQTIDTHSPWQNIWTSTSRWTPVSTYIRERWTRKWRWLFWKWSVWWYIWFMLWNAGIYSIIEYTGREIRWLQWEQSSIGQILSLGITGRERIIVFIMIAIIAPLVEEIVFRTMFTDQCMYKRWYIWVAFVAVVFSAIHGEFAVFRDLTALALILWVIYYKTGSTRYSFAFHVIVNGISVIAMSQGMV